MPLLHNAKPRDFKWYLFVLMIENTPIGIHKVELYVFVEAQSFNSNGGKPMLYRIVGSVTYAYRGHMTVYIYDYMLIILYIYIWLSCMHIKIQKYA